MTRAAVARARTAIVPSEEPVVEMRSNSLRPTDTPVSEDRTRDSSGDHAGQPDPSADHAGQPDPSADHAGQPDSSGDHAGQPDSSGDYAGQPDSSGDYAGQPDSSGDYAGWIELVERIRTGESGGMAELYRLFSRGIRFYLCRQLGSQDLDDKVHDTFVIVVQAIRRGDLREPARLMGFVRTIVRRQVAAHIEKAIQGRREFVEFDSTARVLDPTEDPERTAMFQQRSELIRKVLSELSSRDQEILTRFYVEEQTQEQICAEMSLSDTQFRLLKSRAKARFGELGKKKLAQRALAAVSLRTSAGSSH